MTNSRSLKWVPDAQTLLALLEIPHHVYNFLAFKENLLVACLCNSLQRILLIDISISVSLIVALGKCLANAEEPRGGKRLLPHDGYVDEIGNVWLVGI